MKNIIGKTISGKIDRPLGTHHPKHPDKNIAVDVQAVITSYNQKKLIVEAVESLVSQTNPPSRIIVVDDGSKDLESLEILKQLERRNYGEIEFQVIYKDNGGVSQARNEGINHTTSPYVLILDGDDNLEPTFIEKVGEMLRNDKSMVAASSWMKTFGVLDSVVCPKGGDISSFLSHNACPATHIVRRGECEKIGGYDETMKSGFEDWEYFIHLLEGEKNKKIGILEEPLLNYQTSPASSNIQSMNKRLQLMEYIINKHKQTYCENIVDALLGIEKVSISRLLGWENEMCQNFSQWKTICTQSEMFMKSPSYGDGGMASAVRIATKMNEKSTS